MRAILLAAAALAAALPAEASQGIFCGAAEAEPHIHLPLGGGVGLSVLDATITLDGRRWTTRPADAGDTAIVVGQAAAPDERYYFDFTDADHEGIVIRIRLFQAGVGEEGALGGTLEIRDVGAWPIACGIG